MKSIQYKLNRGQPLRRNRLIKACLEVDYDDDKVK
jgi:hypothetical protein